MLRINAKQFGIFGGICLAVIGAVLIIFMMFNTDGIRSTDPQESLLQNQPQIEIVESQDLQTAIIEIGSKGYSPDHIELKEGIMAKLDFRLTSAATGCTKQLVSDDLRIESTLNEGDNYFLIRDLTPGTYQYSCGTGELYGFITVLPKKSQSP